MSRKISVFFKIKPANSPNEAEKFKTAEIKEEKEVHFQISFKELKAEPKDVSMDIKKEEVTEDDQASDYHSKSKSQFTENPPKTRECKTILNDVKDHELKLFDSILTVDTEKDENVCKICNKKLSTKYHLTEHIKNIHPNRLNLFKCTICDKKYLNNLFLEQHIKNKHSSGQTEYFECDFDSKVFKSRRSLYIHMDVHLPKVKCKICQKELKPQSLNQHLSSFHASTNEFKCKICSKGFKSKMYLDLHSKTHNKVHECNICNKTFPLKTNLKKHKMEVHENLRAFECQICGKKFNRIYILKSHQKLHDRNRPKPLKCQRCDFATDAQRNFNIHKKSHERQDKKFAEMKNPIKCEKCPTFCKDKIALCDHMRKVHPTKLFQCDLCAKFFKIKRDFVKHMIFHIKITTKMRMKSNSSIKSNLNKIFMK